MEVQQFLSRKQSFFSAKDGIHLSPHGSQFWLLKAEKAWLCFNKIIGRVFFMDLLRSKSEKYAATVVTSWKTRLKKSCGFHQGFRGCLLDRGKTTAVDLWEVLTAKWLGWFHAKMQNTAATCLFFIDHWGPKKKSRQAKRLSKSRDGFIGCGHCGFLSKECWIRLHSIDKRVLSSKIHVTCNSQLGVFWKIVEARFPVKVFASLQLEMRWWNLPFNLGSKWKITSVPSTSTKSSGGPHESDHTDLFPHNDWLEVGSKSQPAFFRTPKNGEIFMTCMTWPNFRTEFLRTKPFGPWIVAILGFWASNFGIAQRSLLQRHQKKCLRIPSPNSWEIGKFPRWR